MLTYFFCYTVLNWSPCWFDLVFSCINMCRECGKSSDDYSSIRNASFIIIFVTTFINSPSSACKSSRWRYCYLRFEFFVNLFSWYSICVKEFSLAHITLQDLLSCHPHLKIIILCHLLSVLILIRSFFSFFMTYDYIFRMTLLYVVLDLIS